MSIEVEKVMNGSLDPVDYTWDEDRVILYHLGVGAGAAFTDPRELEYTDEKKLKVLPTFAVLPGFAIAPQVPRLPGTNLQAASIVHGEHEIVLHRPVPVAAVTRSTGKMTAIYDRGSGAALEFKIDTVDRGTGELLFSNIWTLFARGAGGFGGPAAPKTEFSLPDRAADAEVRSPLIPQIAQIYRLSGDKAFLHIDPEGARRVGFDTPIVHGLCSFGVITKAVVDSVLEGDVTKVKRVRMRFAKPLYPGETVVTRCWKEGGRILIDAVAEQRGVNVVANAWVEIAS